MTMEQQLPKCSHLNCFLQERQRMGMWRRWKSRSCWLRRSLTPTHLPRATPPWRSAQSPILASSPAPLNSWAPFRSKLP